MTVYAVDIDGTLCEEDEIWWNYKDKKPIVKNIVRVNNLYRARHTIIIYTARFEEDREVTEQWLESNGVRYHRLVMDKFRADVYIDEDSIKPEDIPMEAPFPE